MTAPSAVDELAAAKLTEFLDEFFSPPNDASNYPKVVSELRQQVGYDDEIIVLPRFHDASDHVYVYVIARRSITARQAQELITAFAGPSYAMAGDRFPIELDLADPIERAIAEFTEGEPGVVFRVNSDSNTKRRQALRMALENMRDVLKKTPTRTWAPGKPLGRLIADFDAALAAGGSATSESIIQQIVNRGGINATNLAHLRIKRFDRLGLSRELLAMDELPYVLVQKPPRPVKEAVLNAAYATAIEGPLSEGDIDTAINSLANIKVPLPVLDEANHYGPEAVTVLLTAAIGRHDAKRVPTLLQGHPAALHLPEPLLAAARSLAISEEDLQHTLSPQPAPTPQILSWLDLLTTDSESAVAKVRENEEWRGWAPISDSDGPVSEHLAQLDDVGWSSAWNRVGIVLEAVDYQSTIPNTSREFINYALSSDKFSQGDLLTVSALADAFLRTGPSQADYHAFLQELLDTSPQWVSPENAEVTLDFADLLIRMPCPAESARLNLGHGLLGPLHRHQARLDARTHAFAQQLSQELNLQLHWTSPETSEPSAQEEFSNRTVLLYSLDESVLKRVAEELQRQFPTLRIHLSHDKDGSPTLKQKARNSDVVALAVRCAKHAATGFIRENAKNKDAVICANGSGSASLFSAAIRGLSRQQRSVR